jgi:KipI family sensor histidine kinase inhibitor
MYKIILAGENSILIYFADKIDKSLPSNIANFTNALKIKYADVIIDLIPSYTSLLVTYNLNKINYLQFSTNVQTLLNGFEFSNFNQNSNLIRIPVYYDFATGLDLKRLLIEKNLTIEEFIKIHSSKSYLVYAIGFSPVFAFLGQVDARIQAPRLATPRIQIPAGSVGIADNQTAIYPTNSSAGWNIIGRTTLDLSLNNPDNLHKFKTGDRVKFYPISRDEFIKYGGKL